MHVSEYEIPNLRTTEEIRQQMQEQIVDGYRPVWEEAITYASGTDAYTLYCDNTTPKKVYDIIRVVGMLNGIENEFTFQADYILTDTTGDGNYDSISWSPGGDQPDDGTVFYVDYRYIVVPSGLTDISDGSVLMTIIDACALQIRLVELKLNDVARDSFIDSADGLELDELGEIVGVARNDAIQATGYVTMARPANMTSGIITIPVGTQISTVSTSASPAIVFETTAEAQIDNTETTAYVSDSSHSDYNKQWIPVQAVNPGISGNVSSDTIIKNVNANSAITNITNPTSFDASDETITGTGTQQVFTLPHPVDSNGFVDKDSDGKAIEVANEDIRGWLSQPASAGKVRVTLSSTWTGTVTIVGYSAADGDNVSDTITFSASSGPLDNSNIDFTYIYYITFSGSSGGLGSITARIQCPATGGYIVGSSTGQAVDDRVDSGFTALYANDDAYDSVQVYSGGSWTDDTSNWTRNTVNISTYARTHYSYSAGLASWESTYGSDGTKKVRFGYVPTETVGTGSEYQYTVDGDSLELLWPLVDASNMIMDFTWENQFVDGADVEADDNYRERIKSGTTASAKGTLAAIQAAVLSVDGIAGTTVDDYSTDPSISVGEVNVFAWSSAGVLSEAKKSEVIAAVEEVRAAGIRVTVSGPTAIYIAIGLTVNVPQDQGYVLATVEAACESAITNWLNSFSVGDDIYESELITVVEAVDGVSYVTMTSITVEGYDDPSDTSVSQEPPHDSGSYWDWDSATGGWNVIEVNSGYIVKADTDSTGTSVNVTAQYE